MLKRIGLDPAAAEFVSKHQLPLRWLELREACNRLVERIDFWYRADIRDAARRLAVEASDILPATLKLGEQSKMPKLTGKIDMNRSGAAMNLRPHSK